MILGGSRRLTVAVYATVAVFILCLVVLILGAWQGQLPAAFNVVSNSFLYYGGAVTAVAGSNAWENRPAPNNGKDTNHE